MPNGTPFGEFLDRLPQTLLAFSSLAQQRKEFGLREQVFEEQKRQQGISNLLKMTTEIAGDLSPAAKATYLSAIAENLEELSPQIATAIRQGVEPLRGRGEFNRLVTKAATRGTIEDVNRLLEDPRATPYQTELLQRQRGGITRAAITGAKDLEQLETVGETYGAFMAAPEQALYRNREVSLAKTGLSGAVSGVLDSLFAENKDSPEYQILSELSKRDPEAAISLAYSTGHLEKKYTTFQLAEMASKADMLDLAERFYREALFARLPEKERDAAAMEAMAETVIGSDDLGDLDRFANKWTEGNREEAIVVIQGMFPGTSLSRLARKAKKAKVKAAPDTTRISEEAFTIGKEETIIGRITGAGEAPGRGIESVLETLYKIIKKIEFE